MNILEKIVREKEAEVTRLPPCSVSELRLAMERRLDRRDFYRSLLQPPRGDIALIAEIKKASPSAGVIRPDFDPVQIARAYQEGGAACLSVLTDQKFFQGSLDYLSRIRPTVTLPLLRKDFIIDERQILESLRAGADAILLIVAILTEAQLRRFLWLSGEARLDALVEVHDAAELDRAADAGARIIGVNNRDLRTFQVNLTATETLAARLRKRPSSPAPLLVAESGIHTRADAERLRNAGARAILVGESLMRQSDFRGKMAELLGAVR